MGYKYYQLVSTVKLRVLSGVDLGYSIHYIGYSIHYSSIQSLCGFNRGCDFYAAVGIYEPPEAQSSG